MATGQMQNQQKEQSGSLAELLSDGMRENKPSWRHPPLQQNGARWTDRREMLNSRQRKHKSAPGR
ncbi:hypothetical protein E8E15_002881 [Penicillium rubens]|nr:hypothetical protein E8E15_002881 [Penicillium rubens]